MKTILIFITLLFLSTSSYSKSTDDEYSESEKNDYEHIIVFAADSQNSVEDMTVIDPYFDFLKFRIGLDDEGVKSFTDDAEAFFLNQFGLDFTDVEWVNGTKSIPGVQLVSFWLNDEHRYRTVYYTHSAGNDNVIFGGFFVTILSDDVTYHGKYGGLEGKAAHKLDVIAQGFYHVDRGPYKKPIIMSIRNRDVPITLTPEGWCQFSNDVELISPYSAKGQGDGIATVVPRDNGVWVNINRNMITFPERLNE